MTNRPQPADIFGGRGKWL